MEQNDRAVDLLNMTQKRDSSRADVNTLMNPRVSLKCGGFFI